jgi:hypothetical protein
MLASPVDTPPRAPDASGPDGSRPRVSAILVALLVIFGVLGLVFISASSQTSDEAAHIAAGYSYLKRADFRLNPEHPPLLKEIAAVPLLFLDLAFPGGRLWERGEEWNIGRIFVHENRVRNDTILLLSRLPMLLLSILLAVALFRWGRDLFGPRGALLSVALYVLDPTVLAHSCLVTTDLGLTLFIFLSVYAVWAWSRNPSPGRLLLIGLMVGCAFASKFSALWLLPILASLAFVLLVTRAPIPARPWRADSVTAGGGRIPLRRIGSLAMAGVILSLVAFAVLTATYAVRGLPAYAFGLEQGLHHSAVGHSAYLRGELAETGWWYYFLYGYLIKTPIGTLILVGLSLLAMLRGWRASTRSELFLWIPILIVIGITCSWKINIGLRHLLPIYPFLYLSAGRILCKRAEGRAVPPASAWSRRLLPAAIALCLAWNVVEAARITPHQIAYFNQFVGGPENGHRHLLDSNLDWGQAGKALKRYMDSEGVPLIYCAFAGNSDPWYIGVRYQYVPGSGNLQNPKRRGMRLPDDLPRELLAVSAMVRHSTHFTNHSLYDWLDGREPIAMPGYAYLVYDITGDAAAHAQIAVACLNFRLFELAMLEARRALALEPGNDLARAVLEKIREEMAAGRTGPSLPGRTP